MTISNRDGPRRRPTYLMVVGHWGLLCALIVQVALLLWTQRHPTNERKAGVRPLSLSWPRRTYRRAD
jgi:hypothetical protein